LAEEEHGTEDQLGAVTKTVPHLLQAAAVVKINPPRYTSSNCTVGPQPMDVISLETNTKGRGPISKARPPIKASLQQRWAQRTGETTSLQGLPYKHDEP
jgi:hypothetical protein